MNGRLVKILMKARRYRRMKWGRYRWKLIDRIGGNGKIIGATENTGQIKRNEKRKSIQGE